MESSLPFDSVVQGGLAFFFVYFPFVLVILTRNPFLL